MGETCGTHERGELWPPNVKEETSLDTHVRGIMAHICEPAMTMKYTSMSWADFSAVRYWGGFRLLRAQLVRLES